MNTSNIDQLISTLKQRLKSDQVLTDHADTWAYGSDNSRRHSLPDVVVFPESAEDVQHIVRCCRDNHTAIVARGRGTNTTGATVPLEHGVVISFERMNRILSIDPANRVAVVEPGVTNQALQDALAEHGFFWPPDPTSAAYCTIGGNLACNAAGPRAVKYGTPRENTLGLTAITGAGDILKTGVYTTKGVVGYDFTRLIVGSEGSLAVITQATLKLTPLQQDKKTIQAFYRDMQGAAQAVADIMAQPHTPCALEFIDGAAIDMIRDYSTASLPVDAKAMLMIEVDGATASLDAIASEIVSCASNGSALSVTLAQSQEEVDALWATRKALSPALKKVAPKKINEDVVVPVSRMPELIEGLAKLSKEHQIRIVNFGHAGNGNIHVNLLTNPDDEDEAKRAHACLRAVFELVLSMNGTLSGEHGVGIEKRDFVFLELSETALRLMRDVKRVFDPDGILNPGKMIPDEANTDIEQGSRIINTGKSIS